MFGRRQTGSAPAPAPIPQPRFVQPAPAPLPAASREAPQPARPAPIVVEAARSDEYYRTKSLIFGALIEAIDLTQLAHLDAETAREEIRDIVTEIIGLKNIVLSISEQEELLDDICNDVLGYGPLEPLLAHREPSRTPGR